jgi:hypothetical protein
MASGTHGAPDDAPLGAPDGSTPLPPEPEGRPETPDQSPVPLPPVPDGLPVLRAPVPEGLPALLTPEADGLPPPPPNGSEVGGGSASPELGGTLAS